MVVLNGKARHRWLNSAFQGTEDIIFEKLNVCILSPDVLGLESSGAPKYNYGVQVRTDPSSSISVLFS